MPEPMLAFLGPAGTYGHQAAQAFSAQVLQPRGIKPGLVPCPNISAVYASTAEYRVMPLQNTLHGAVLETLDCLLSCLSSLEVPSRKGKERERAPVPEEPADDTPRLVASLDLHIQHCLVARRGTKMEDIRWVRSHEQALGQSARFLKARLPQAERVKWASTAGAAVSLLDPPDPLGEPEEMEGVGAAICSKAVAELYPELEVLHVGTQDIEDNYTRFILLVRSGGLTIPSTHPAHGPAPSHFYAVASPTTLSEMLTLQPCRAIHTRPAPPEHQRTAECRFPMRSLVVLGAELAVVPDDVRYLGSVVYLGSA